MAITTHVQSLIDGGRVGPKVQTDLEALEKFVLEGDQMFEGKSMVIKGRAMNYCIKRNFDHYKAIITELLGTEKGEEIDSQRAMRENREVRHYASDGF